MRYKKVVSIIAAGVLSVGFLSAKNLASVDGVNITEKDFDVYKQQMPNFNFDQLSQEQKLGLINQRINEILIEKEAKKEKLQDSKEYKEALNNIAKQLLINAWQQKVFQDVSAVKTSDADLKKFYDENSNQFINQEGHARHILLKTKEEAEKLIADLNKTQKSKLEARFIDLANKNSIDPNTQKAQNGGDLGVFQRSQMVPEFARAVFSLQPGTYTKTPVQTSYGYHIIYLLKKDEPKKISFEEAKSNIENIFAERRLQQEIQNKIQALRNKASITISN